MLLLLRMAQYVRRQPEKTTLYKIIQENWLTFKDSILQHGESLPKYVESEFEEFLKCGILAYGFLRNRCEACGKDHVLGFSCKRRGFCPSCMGRRMSETTIFLSEQVIQNIPVRQWVLSVPLPLRYWMARSPRLLTQVHKITSRAISTHYRELAKPNRGRVGEVCLIQRFGSDLRLNVHFHMIFSEGIWDDGGKFHGTRGPTDLEVENIVKRIKNKCLRLLLNLGYLQENGEEASPSEDDAEEGSIFNKALAAAIRANQLFKPNYKVPRVGQWDKQFEAKIKGPKCATIDYFSLHANTYVAPNDKKSLGRLIGYVTRPSVCEARLSIDSKGNVLYKLKKPFSDGTLFVSFAPLEFLARLMALIPKPRTHLIIYSGMFARRTKSRNKVVIKRNNPESTCPKQHRQTWTKLLKKVFDIDIEKCPFCGGRMRLLKPVLQIGPIKKILDHLKLDCRAPPLAPSRICLTENFDF